MVEIKTNPRHPSSMSERIAKRLRNSGGEEADTTVKTGDGPTRVFHNLHNSGNARRHGEVNRGEGNINNEPYTDRRREASDNDY